MKTAGRRNRWRRGERKLVIHFHIFKNAGTSIDETLAEAYGDEWEPFEGFGDHDPIAPQRLAERLANRPQIRAVSSHLLRPPAPIGFDVFPIVILRQPLDRAYSCYSHERRCAPNSESCEVARATDFAGYVRWCLDNPRLGGIVIANYQTIHLSHASFRGELYDAEPTEADFRQALELLLSLPFPGLVDRFEELVKRLPHAITRWQGNTVAFGDVRHSNVSPERRRSSLTETVGRLRAELGIDLHERFVAANRFDQTLYDVAAGIF